MNTLTVSLQALHLLCAFVWFGSLIYTELILWPRMRRVGLLAAVQDELRSVNVRKMMAVAVVGTIVLGFARGAAGGCSTAWRHPTASSSSSRRSWGHR